MLYTDVSQLELDKYQRLFVFGCSFTGYRWPTWADLIAHTMPQAKYINMARSGAGQLYILCQLSQCINHHNIGKDDLVAIMWSTFYREDRYMYQRASQNWSTPGNIFTARHEIPEEYVDKYVCTRGMFVRDLALIDTTMRMLEHSDFDSFAMMGVGLENQDWTAGLSPEQALPMDDVKELYGSLSQKMLPPLMETQFPEGWDTCYRYWDDDMGSEFADYHPSIQQYAEYLSKIGFVLPESTASFVEQQHQLLLKVSNKSQLGDHVPCMIL